MTLIQYRLHFLSLVWSYRNTMNKYIRTFQCNMANSEKLNVKYLKSYDTSTESNRRKSF